MGKSYKFAFVSNSETISKVVYRHATSQGISMVVRLATMEDALPVAQELIDAGINVILGGGGTGKLLRQQLKQPVVTISRTHFDILRTLFRIRHAAKYVAITSYGEITEGLNLFADLLNIRIKPIVFHSTQELTDGISQAIDSGVDYVIGGGICMETAREMGCRGSTIIPSSKVIQRALEEAVNIAESQHSSQKHAAWLEGALDSLHEGIVGVDEAGTILFSNTKAADFLNTDQKNEGSIFTDFLNVIQIDQVLRNGEYIPDNICSFDNRSFVTNIRPIRINSDIDGAIAAFRPATYLRTIDSKLRKHVKNRGFTAKYTFTDLIGQSANMRALRKRSQRFAQTDANIFIQGETGTGKELLAHALHNAGSRAHEPFVAVNCAALPDSLLESELFGYEEGAFTGARKGGKEGLFLLANKGTIFLDEIADISALLQVRLLRVLESQEIFQVGGVRVIPISVRVVSSSWKNLAREVQAGRFRADLYYRLTTLNVQIPPLRDRVEDIPEICGVLLHRLGFSSHLLSPAEYSLLSTYAWPGNVRELAALLHRYVLLKQDEEPNSNLLAELLQELIDSSAQLTATPNTMGAESSLLVNVSLKQQVERHERKIIRQTLLKNNQNKSLTAQQLGISEHTLWRKMKGE
ncbi:sigma 54-interacting transcriptional regulator [Desulfobulbus oligotrophicus]|uniref:Sigma 54-interacting transcriptional regulator n=2 Tax=Desulfobulbus oligotrophicus TaxID=1909699 RepID=A0A7T5VEG0_9BACT|nr:sigma 54-interacting transcriptional regulator [Desulfobulbus oligotrophicus]